MKKSTYKMQKFTAGGLAVAAVLFFVSVGCSVARMPRGEKHTGPVTVRRAEGRSFEFKRPNGEIFEMAFSPDYLGPQIARGDELSDLTYTDQKNHLAFFVKATLSKEIAEKPPADKILYERGGEYSYYCGGSICTTSVNGREFYLWKDGGYREKPEAKKERK